MKMDNSITTRLRNELITFAKMKRKMDYVSLSQAAGYKETEIEKVDNLLREISVQDHQEDKPLLWSMVIMSNSTLPSEAYFHFLKSQGISESSTDTDQVRIHAEQLEKVFSYWSRRRKTGPRKR